MSLVSFSSHLVFCPLSCVVLSLLDWSHLVFSFLCLLSFSSRVFSCLHIVLFCMLSSTVSSNLVSFLESSLPLLSCLSPHLYSSHLVSYPLFIVLSPLSPLQSYCLVCVFSGLIPSHFVSHIVSLDSPFHPIIFKKKFQISLSHQILLLGIL